MAREARPVLETQREKEGSAVERPEDHPRLVGDSACLAYNPKAVVCHKAP